jgi:hypothetical protein
MMSRALRAPYRSAPPPPIFQARSSARNGSAAEALFRAPDGKNGKGPYRFDFAAHAHLIQGRQSPGLAPTIRLFSEI